MFQARLLAVAAASALLAACGTSANQVIPAQSGNAQASSHGLTMLSTFTARDNTTGALVRVLPPQDVFSSIRGNDRAAMTTSNLTYHNGPVAVTPHIYVVFWGSTWSSSTGDPDGVGTRIKNFLSIVGGSKWLNSVTQYTQSNGSHVGNASGSFIGSYIDTSSTPPSNPSQSAMAAEATKAAAHYGDYSTGASYVVALPHGVKPSGFGTQWCAWHSSTSTSGGTIAYTNLPYMPDVGTSCGANSVNSGSTGLIDGVSIVEGHEQGETETDPQPNTGWLDSSGSENGDKCAWTQLENNPNAGGYPTQPLWSNATSSCVQSY